MSFFEVLRKKFHPDENISPIPGNKFLLFLINRLKTIIKQPKKNRKVMKMSENETKSDLFKLLTRDEMDILIYMTSDVWITSEVVRFKNDLIERAGI